MGNEVPATRMPRPVDGLHDGGQATVEYALVLFAFLATVVCMGALWRAASRGALVELAVDSASHASGDGASFATLQDTLLY